MLFRALICQHTKIAWLTSISVILFDYAKMSPTRRKAATSLRTRTIYGGFDYLTVCGQSGWRNGCSRLCTWRGRPRSSNWRRSISALCCNEHPLSSRRRRIGCCCCCCCELLPSESDGHPMTWREPALMSKLWRTGVQKTEVDARITRRALGRAHLPPTMVFRRLKTTRRCCDGPGAPNNHARAIFPT